MSDVTQEERADNTRVYHAKRVYKAMLELNKSIFEAFQAGVAVGIVSELEMKPMIEDLKRVTGIYKTTAETPQFVLEKESLIDF